MKRTVLLICAAMLGCGGACDVDRSDRGVAKPSVTKHAMPPRVGAGIRVVVGGDAASQPDSVELIGVFARVLQLEEDYFAYQVAPAPTELFGLLTAGGEFAARRRDSGGAIGAHQREGLVVVAVVRVERRGAEAEIQYCQDDRKLLYYSLDNLSAPPKPAEAHIQPNKFSVRLIRTTGKAADGTTSDDPRWLVADPTGFDPEDPACLAPIAAVRVPPIALHPRPGEI